jgi:hypothetical protein
MIPELCPSEKIMSIKNPRWLPPQDESFNIGPYGKKDINPETRNLIKPKKYMF